MGLSADTVVDKLIGVMLIAVLSATIVPYVLDSFLNLSTSGLVLATLFSSVLGIVLAVAIFKGIFKNLKM